MLFDTNCDNVPVIFSFEFCDNFCSVAAVHQDQNMFSIKLLPCENKNTSSVYEIRERKSNNLDLRQD